jgi:hypothetical protein
MDGLDGDHVVIPTVTSRNNGGAVFSVRSRCLRFTTRTANHLLDFHLLCGGGVEYLHRNLVSRRMRRKEKSRIWDSKIYSRVPGESEPKRTALARTRRNCKRRTGPLVRESAPHEQTRNCLTVIRIWSWAPDGCFIPKQTGRLIVGRNISLRLRHTRLKTWRFEDLKTWVKDLRICKGNVVWPEEELED